MHKIVQMEADVVVVGAGPGGLTAAISAARQGCKVILVERSSTLGGAAASGLTILGYLDRQGNKVLGGIAQEYHDRLEKIGASIGHYRCPVHNSMSPILPDAFALVAVEMCDEAGVQVLFNCDLYDVFVENQKVKEVTVYSKSTKIRIKGKIFVDGTGDGDLAYMAGEEFRIGNALTGVNQPSTLVFSVSNFDLDEFFDYVEQYPDAVGIKEEYAKDYDLDFFRNTEGHCLIGLNKLIEEARAKGEFDIPRNQFIYIKTADKNTLAINTSRIVNIDTSDPLQLSNGVVEGYRQVRTLMNFIKKYIPGFNNAVLSRISPTLGIRESRHFKGIDTVTKDDALNYVIDERTIGLCGYNVDIHSGNSDHIDLFLLEKAFGLPYGCMVPANIKGLFLSGRIISADDTAFAAVRVMGPIIAMSEAVGVAAKICIDENIEPCEVDVAKVREILRTQGAILGYE